MRSLKRIEGRYFFAIILFMNKKTQRDLLEVVKNNYEEIASEFHESRKKPLWPKLQGLANLVPSGSYILDAGCGNGRLFKAFEKKKVNYLGVDQSKNLIELAKKDLKKMPYQQVEFLVSDLLTLSNIHTVDFDFVFCIAVLHHIPGRDLRIALLKQLKNKVKQDGKIIISVWKLWKNKKMRWLAVKFFLLRMLGKNQMDFGDLIFSWKSNKKHELSKRYYHAFTKWEFKKIIKEAGLKIEKIEEDEFNYYIVAKV